MSDQPETIAAVLAEMRDGIHTGRADIIDIVNDVLARYADRIESAVERERNAHKNDIHDALYKATGIPGNAAAMRDALNRVGHLAKDLRNITERDTEVRADVNEIVDVCRTALAAPARNCDRFATAEDARRAFESAHSHGIVHNLYTATFDWLFDKAEGGDHA